VVAVELETTRVPFLLFGNSLVFFFFFHSFQQMLDMVRKFGRTYKVSVSLFIDLKVKMNE
jgi:hypothetical protein